MRKIKPITIITLLILVAAVIVVVLTTYEIEKELIQESAILENMYAVDSCGIEKVTAKYVYNKTHGYIINNRGIILEIKGTGLVLEGEVPNNIEYTWSASEETPEIYENSSEYASYEEDGTKITYNLQEKGVVTGKNYLHYKYTAPDGENTREKCISTLPMFDKTNPIINVSNLYDDIWTRNGVEITVAAQDADSGIKKLQYKMEEDEEWTDWSAEETASITITQDYLGEFYVKAIDNTYNEVIESTTVKIDTEAPKITVEGNKEEWTEENITLEIKVESDSGAPLHEEPYSFNGGETWQKEPTKEYEENIQGIIINVRDIAGNIYTHEEINITSIRKPVKLEVAITPDKTSYVFRENFDPKGMEVIIRYDNGDIEDTTDYTILNGIDLTCLVKLIEIQYNKNTELKDTLAILVEHNEEMLEGKESRCTETGLTDGKQCSVCGEITLKQEETPATGHVEEIDERVEPTCTETGLTEGKHCSVCDEILILQEIIPETGHTEVVDGGVEPTCTQSGLTEGKHCSVCDQILILQEIIPTLEHNYEQGKCITCGEEEPKLKVASEEYDIDNLYISNVYAEIKAEELKSKIQTNATTINIYTKDGIVVKDNENITTGMTIEFKFRNETKTLIIVINGDINGNGRVELADMILANRMRLGKNNLQGEYLLAADFDKNGKVSFIELLKINKIRLNKSTNKKV